MAEIRSDIALNDGMSPVLKTIYKTLQPMLRAMEHIQSAMGGNMNHAGLDETRNRVADLTQLISVADTEVEVLARADNVQATITELERINTVVSAVRDVDVGVGVHTEDISVAMREMEALRATTNAGVEVLARADTGALDIAKRQVEELTTTIANMRPEVDMSFVNEAISQTQNLEAALADVKTMAESAHDPSLVSELMSHYSELEGQLASITNMQESFNSAMASGDVTHISSAYEQLNSQVIETRRHIENNTRAKQEFTRQLEVSKRQANLLNTVLKGFSIAGIIAMGRRWLQNNVALMDTYNTKIAQIGLMNDGLQTNEQLQQMIMRSARRVNADFAMMAGTIFKLNATVGDIFANNASVIRFTESIKMASSISGSSLQGIEMAFKAVDRAMAEGAMSARDFDIMKRYSVRSVQAIADYMGVSVAETRNLAIEGTLTAAVLSGAMLGATDDIATEFQAIPKTWADITTRMRNSTLEAFSGFSTMFSDFINNPEFKSFLNIWETGIHAIAGVLAWVFGFMERGFNRSMAIIDIVVDNLDLIVIALTAIAVVYAVVNAAAIGSFLKIQMLALKERLRVKKDAMAKKIIALKTEAIRTASALKTFLFSKAIALKDFLVQKTMALKTLIVNLGVAKLQQKSIIMTATTSIKASIGMAMANIKAGIASALAWMKMILPIMMIIGAIMAVIKILDHFGVTTEMVVGFVGGVFGGLFAFLFNLFAGFWNVIASIAEFLVNVWNHPVYSAQKLFYNLISNVLNWFASIVDATGGVGTAIIDAFVNGANGAIGVMQRLLDWLADLPLIGGLFSGFTLTTISGRADDQSAGDWIRSLADGFHPGDAPEDYWRAPQLEMKDILDTAASWSQGAVNGLNGLQGMLGGLGDMGYLPEHDIGLDYDFLAGLNNIEDLMGGGIGAGNNIGDIGQIRDDVHISEEDIKLMRDIGRRETIIHYQPLSPEVTVNYNPSGSNAPTAEEVAQAVEDMIMDKFNSDVA